MIRQLFKLVWHRKKRNFLLISEIFFSFMVLFAVGATAISIGTKYLKPLGYSYENVWVVYLGWYGTAVEKTNPEINRTLQMLDAELRSHMEIRQAAFVSGNVPYQSAQWGTRLDHEGQEVAVDFTIADDHYAEVLDLPLVEGRWFGREDDGSSRTPIVIDGTMRHRLFGDDPALGHIFVDNDGDERVVVGIIGNYRYKGEFNDPRGGFFQRRDPQDTAATAPRMALLSVREGTGVEFEQRLLKRLSSVAPEWTLRIETLENLRASHIKGVLLGLVTMGTVAGFLVFNVALGLFGVLWYSISRRRGEIGLRRALGANAGQVSLQILGEALAVATLAIAAGLFVAVQVPLLGIQEESVADIIYFLAMVAAAVLIYLIVSVCALYPSRLAARIQPAEALHDE